MWGVPITIFISKKTGKPLIDKNVNNKILQVLKEKGVESWFELPNETFLTDSYLPDEYHKVDSILDVWFDSGSSHVYVLKNKKIKDKADLYLEGSDQHRGWFQTSLLESCNSLIKMFGTSLYADLNLLNKGLPYLLFFYFLVRKHD